MTPDKAATLFRELLQTPIEELGMYARRAGLHHSPEPEALSQGRELLIAVSIALESGKKESWEAVESAWKGLRMKGGIPVSDPLLAAKRPGWVRPDMPDKPSLGDAAPGTSEYQEEQAQKQRFVPVARPKVVASSGVPSTPYSADPAPPVMMAQQPGIPSPHAAPQPPAYQQPPQPGQAPYPAQPQPGAAYPGHAPDPQHAQPAPQPVGGYPAAPQQHAGYPAAPQPAAGYPQQATPQQPAPQQAAPQQPAPQQAAPPPGPRRAPPPPPRRGGPHEEAAPQAAPQAAAAPAAEITPLASPLTKHQKPMDMSSVKMSVAKYAAFCAACANNPDRLREIRAQYGIPTQADHDEIDEMWHERFDEDAEAQEEWEYLFKQFRDQLKK